MALTKIDDRGLKTPIDLLDNEKIRFGTGNDLELYHDGTNSHIDNQTGLLVLRNAASNTIHLEPVSNESGIQVKANNAVELYYDNSKKLETTGNGVKIYGGDSGGSYVQGDMYWDNQTNAGKDLHWDQSGNYLHFQDDVKALFGDVGDLEISHNGTDSRIVDTGTGMLRIGGDNTTSIENAALNEYKAKFITNGAVELYYDNSLRFQTDVNGCTVHSTRLQFMDNTKAQFGTGGDFQIYHSGTHSYIKDAGTGNLYIHSNYFIVSNAAGTEDIIKGAENGAVELYHDNSKKLETTSSGVTVTGTVSDSKGNLRSIPKTSKSANYSIVAADAGTCLATNSQITVQGSQMSEGDAVTILNNSGSSINIVRSSFSLFNTGNGNDEDTSLGARGIATIYFLDASNGYISGSSLGS